MLFRSLPENIFDGFTPKPKPRAPTPPRTVPKPRPAVKNWYIVPEGVVKTPEEDLEDVEHLSMFNTCQDWLTLVHAILHQFPLPNEDKRIDLKHWSDIVSSLSPMRQYRKLITVRTLLSTYISLCSFD